MKNTSVIVALVAGISLILSASILAFAIREYGQSLERASDHQPRPVDIPSRITVSLESGMNPLKFNVNTFTNKP